MLPNMTNDEEFYDDEMIVILTIDGTSYEEIEIKVTDMSKTIEEQIASIVQVFELPKADPSGQPVSYRLGIFREDDEENEILAPQDDFGRDLTLLDYDVQPGDHLHLASIPIPG